MAKRKESTKPEAPKPVVRVTQQYYANLYPPQTPLELVEQLELILRSSTTRTYHLPTKYKIHYGNVSTGRSWEQMDKGFIVFGDDGLICLPTEKSKTGPSVRIGCIVKLETSDRVLYRHPLFHTPQEEPPKVVEKPDEGRTFRKIAIRN